MTTVKAHVQKLKRDGESSLYGYQLYAGDDKFAEEVGFSRIADALRSWALRSIPIRPLK